MPGQRELSPLSRREAEKRKFEEDYRKGTEELMLAEAAKEFRDCLLKAGLGKTQRRISQLLAELSRLQAERDRVLGLKQGKLEDILNRYSERFNQMEAQIAGAKGAKRDRIMRLREGFVLKLKQRLQDVTNSDERHTPATSQLLPRSHTLSGAQIRDSEDESDIDDQPLNKRRKPDAVSNDQRNLETRASQSGAEAPRGSSEARPSTLPARPDENDPSSDRVLRTSTLEQHKSGIRTANPAADPPRNADRDSSLSMRPAKSSNTEKNQRENDHPLAHCPDEDRLSFGRIRPRARSSESDPRSPERDRSISRAHNTDAAAHQNARDGVASGSGGVKKPLTGQEISRNYSSNGNRLSLERDRPVARSGHATLMPTGKAHGNAPRAAYCAISFAPRIISMKSNENDCIEVAGSATGAGPSGGTRGNVVENPSRIGPDLDSILRREPESRSDGDDHYSSEAWPRW